MRFLWKDGDKQCRSLSLVVSKVPAVYTSLPGGFRVSSMFRKYGHLGDRTVPCRVGSGVANIHLHNVAGDCVFCMGKELQVLVGREPCSRSRSLKLACWPCAGSPLAVFFSWEHVQDLYVDVVGSAPLALSYHEDFVPGGSVVRAFPSGGFLVTCWRGRCNLRLCSNRSRLIYYIPSVAIMHQLMSFCNGCNVWSLSRRWATKVLCRSLLTRG
jgi:hypothetical protein